MSLGSLFNTLLQDLAQAPEAASGLGRAVLALAKNRLELFRLELACEKERLIKLVFLAVLAALLCLVAFGLGLAAVIYAVGPQYRLTVLVAAAVVIGLAAVVSVLILARSLRNLPAPFEELSRELEKDRELL